MRHDHDNNRAAAIGAAPSRPGDATIAAESIGLPDGIADLIRRTVGGTRLWRSEQSEVARELASHFAEGLAAGRAEDELISAFGDPREASRLIRRAVKRNRSLTWRLATTTAKGVGITTLALIAGFVVLAIRFSVGTPNVTRNVTAELNARHAHVPVSERAWPMYVRAVPAFTRESQVVTGDWPGVRPGDEAWSATVEWLRANAATLATIRDAASRPTLGLDISNTYDPDYMAAKALAQGHPPEAAAPDANPTMIEILLPQLGEFRTFARALVQDAYVAVHEGDGDRAVANLVAISGIAAHAHQQPFLISSLVGIAITAMQSEHLLRLLDQRPDAFSDANLRELAHLLGSQRTNDALRIDYQAERVYFEDFVQRAFTDDGRGGGRLTPEGFRFLNSLDGLAGPDAVGAARISDTIVGPLLSIAVGNRREITAAYARLMSEGQAIASQPLWRTDTSRFDAFVDELTATPLRQSRNLPILWLAPTVSKSHAASEVATCSRDAALVAIALELHRRRHGEYPAALGDLVPVFLPAVPPDRFDGNPLRYALRDGRPLLYSIGVDGIDDAGVPPKKGPRGAGQWRSAPELAASLATPMGRDRHSGDWVFLPVFEPTEE
ncbi:MAG: hypothetical protein KIS87_01840 [Phycisphaeraceae bacterium]|nr:hypothetical protein [Phycisphaeraceae bacterium]